MGAEGCDEMIKAVMFDMGGTLEDVFVDETSELAAIDRLDEMLRAGGLDPKVDKAELKRRADEGWKRYGAYRDRTGEELKPISIWCDYVLTDFAFPREALEPLCEPIAHMWELTHYHRALRPRVAEMLQGLKDLGLKLGVISNTAAMYQVFDSLEEYGIRDYFSDVTLSSVTGMRKPLADIFYVSTRQLRVSPKECVYVGDTVSRDIIGSKKAGFACAIQIGSQLTREKDSGVRTDLRPDHVIEDIYEVFPLVREMLRQDA